MSVTTTIWQVVVGLREKAATSPLFSARHLTRVLKSMVACGDERGRRQSLLRLDAADSDEPRASSMPSSTSYTAMSPRVAPIFTVCMDSMPSKVIAAVSIVVDHSSRDIRALRQVRGAGGDPDNVRC